MKAQRHSAILDRVREGGIVTVDELSACLRVSPSTIRRDLDHLDRAGVLRRVHGGAAVARLLGGDAEAPFGTVAQADVADKDAVARAVAALIPDGSVVAVDVGTTTRLVARRLRGRPVTVVTSSLAVVDELRDDERVELILLGGLLRRSYHSLVGVLTEDAIGQLQLDLAVLGTSGIRSGYVLDTTLVEVPVKRALIRAARRVVVAADSHKLPGSGTLRVCPVSAVDTIVTNSTACPEAVESCREAGAEVLLA